ncbi:MAG: ABC transporter substrate-binding protein, partial [Flavobacterium sp.]
MYRSYKYLTYCIVLLLLTGCYYSEKEGENYFHYNEQTGIASLDPAFAKNQSIMWSIHQLYNTLVEVDSQLNIVPSIAKRWEVSADRTIYTFYLRNDIFFHNVGCFPNSTGRRLVASDVVYSLNRIVNDKVASPGSWIFNDKVDSINGFIALNDTTLQVKLIRPYNPILGILSMQYCSVIPHEAVEKYGNDFRRHAVGTGPFQFVAWEEGQSLILKKNNRYFERDEKGMPLPYLDGVKVSFYDSKATEFLLFRQKKLDFINDIDASFKDEVLTKKGILSKEWEGKIKLQTHPYLNIEYLGLLVDTSNTILKNSPTKIKKVRQAINYGFDRRKLVLYLRNSLGIPAESGFVPAGLPSFDSSKVLGYHYDPVKARQLLKEAGFSQKGSLPQIKLLTIPIYADIGSYIARQLEEIGFNVQVEAIQKSLLLEMTSSSRAVFF